MATLRLCSIPDCGKPVKARGYCNAHYLRAKRHGDPLRGGTANGEPQRFFQNVVLPYDGNECLTWPFGTAGGYGRLGNANVSRLVCELANGAPPSSNYDAAHSCGNGHLGCVTKRHMSWKTRKENMADKITHGTHNRGERQYRAKLTEDKARQILALKGIMKQADIASLMGVRQDQISRIQSGKRWAWL